MNLIQIKHALRSLSLVQLRKLDEWLHGVIRKAEAMDQKKQSSSRKQTAAESTLDNQTYRLESIRCGKPSCKCARGKLHGPYWYRYTSVEDKIISRYIGKNLPQDIAKKLKGREK
jgi:hypothetical protein